MNEAIKIVLVDGRELIRHGLRRMLESEKDMQVVGDYASAEQTLIETIRLRQDIVLMGTQLPGMNWLEAICTLKRSGPNSDGEVIILAESVDYRVEALKAGAAKYLLKDVTSVELSQAIRQTYRNKHWSKERDGFNEEVVELIVPSSVNAARLLRFMWQLGEIARDDFTSIICTVGSWNRGTIITIRSQPAAYSTLLIALANMPEVEKVDEELVTKTPLVSFYKKFGLLPRLKINPSKRLHLTLKENDMAG